MTAAIALVLLLAGVGATLLLYLAIEAETSNPQLMDRAEAERQAMQEGGRQPNRESSPDGERGDRSWGEDRRDDGRRDDHETNDDEHLGYSRLDDSRER